MANGSCHWCGGLVTASGHPGARPAKYCSAAHKDAYHTACRNYGHHQVEVGEISVAQLRRQFGKDAG